MRLIKTFILRLYTDPEMREKICGDLQALPRRKTYPFRDKAELLNLLQRLANGKTKEIPMRITEDENESDSHRASNAT